MFSWPRDFGRRTTAAWNSTLLVVALLVGSVGCGSSRAASDHTRIVVFAAASLQKAFTILGQEFERTHPGTEVVTSFGGSDSLATQILQGAPADVFASADEAVMDRVAGAHRVDHPVVFAANQLEIAVSPGNPKHIATLGDLTRAGIRLALCAPTVPCGAAAKKVFTAAGLQPHPVTLESNVTAVLTKVELGEVDAGLVYHTDVLAAAGKVQGIPFAGSAAATNRYEIGAIVPNDHLDVAREFIEFVLDHRKVLVDAGFQEP
ncbi:MAG: molybdate ABC transporter substrate-binding protein [Acidothermus sp.]|nr:molybdate ABC transporter substrate-binding protein [Acidothermus sp.]